MQVLARCRSQFQLMDGGTACTGIATVFAMNFDYNSPQTMPFETFMQMGVYMWKKWHTVEKKRSNPNSFCEAFELIRDVPELSDALAGGKFAFDIYSGYVLPGVAMHDEMKCLGDAIKAHLAPGQAGVLTDNVHSHTSIAIARSRDGIKYYIFDSHPPQMMFGDKRARLMEFETFDDLMAWLNGPEKINLLEVLRANDGKTADELFHWENLKTLSYTLTTFIIISLPGGEEIGMDSRSCVADTPAVIAKRDSDAAITSKPDVSVAEQSPCVQRRIRRVPCGTVILAVPVRKASANIGTAAVPNKRPWENSAPQYRSYTVVRAVRSSD